MNTLHAAGIGEVSGVRMFVLLVLQEDPLQTLVVDGIVEIVDVCYTPLTVLQALLGLHPHLVNTVQLEWGAGVGLKFTPVRHLI